MGNSQQVFESIFNRSMFENNTNDFLTGIANEYPYFTAAQFYLLQQNDTASDEYNKQLAKTAILFNNPFWLNYQLEQSFGSNSLPEQIITDQLIDSEPIYNIIADEPEIIHPLSGSAKTIFEEEKIIVSEQDIKQETVFEEIPKPITGNPSPVFTETQIAVPADNKEYNQEDTAEVTEEKVIEPISDNPSHVFTTTEINVHEDNKQEETVEVTEDKMPEAVEDNLSPVSTSPEIKDIPENIDENTPGEVEEDTQEKEIEPLNFKLNFTTSIATTEDTISFEPLHTSDYFASLGIKFSDEIKPDDKLGKHLKSFTEWLKTMKKIHPDQLPQQTAQAEISIQQMAEKSNTEGEVLTEAMAEVLLQQGKLGKAIEVYQKLSLLNPLKSAYFAAKIDKIER
jgi:hypothetical protein